MQVAEPAQNVWQLPQSVLWPCIDLQPCLITVFIHKADLATHAQQLRVLLAVI